MSDNKQEFKKGDKAIILLDSIGGRYIKQTTIKNITPKGTIKTDNGLLLQVMASTLQTKNFQLLLVVLSLMMRKEKML